MALYKKTLMIICIVFVALILVLSVTMNIFLMENASKLDQYYVEHGVEDLLYTIHDDIETLDRITGDWAAWDDTYAFIEDENEEYLQSNLVDGTFTGLGLNFIIFFNSSGHLVFGKAVDLYEKREMDVPQGLLDNLSSDAPLIHHKSTESSTFGIVYPSEGPMLVASRPILTSDERGPIRGTLVMGRYLDAAKIERFIRLTNVNFTILPFEGAKLPSDVKLLSTSANSSTLVQQLNEDFMTGYTVVKDIYGDPCLALKAEFTRNAYNQARVSLWYFALSILLTGTVFGTVTIFILHKLVLSPLAVLSTSVKNVEKSGDLSVRLLDFKRDDEISNLAKYFNGMMESLEKSQHKLKESEEKFRTIFNTAADAIFVSDKNMRILDVNQVACDKLGYAHEEIIHLTLADIVTSDSSPHISEIINDAFQKGCMIFEITHVTRDEVNIPSEVSCQKIDYLGSQAVLCIARDITERKQTERELQKREDLLEAAALAAHELLTSIDYESGIKKALEALGLANDIDLVFLFKNYDHPVTGEHLTSHYVGWVQIKHMIIGSISNLQNLSYDRIVPGWYDTLSSGKTISCNFTDYPTSFENIIDDSGWVMASVLLVPVIIENQFWGTLGFGDGQFERNWSDGEISILSAIAECIGGAIIINETEKQLVNARDELELRVEERTSELEVRNAEMERFTYTVSHDLRSPLFTIQGFVGFLEDDIKRGDVKQIEADLEMIRNSIVKMDLLLKDTLELSRIGCVANPPENVFFGDIVEDTLNQISEKVKLGGVNIQVAKEWPMVRVDRLRIAEVLTNLIENGIKYMGDQKTPRIEIGWKKGDVGNVFFVQDNGMGMKHSQHDKAFELFYKIDRESEGSGAGLAIVKRIIEVHGGQIWIESEEGKGCTVLFTLPN